MADVLPLNALHYEPAAAGPLQELVAPPYDVIGPAQRAELAARSPYNVVAIDLPEGDGDRYDRARSIFSRWQEKGAVVRDAEPAIWALEQEYVGPDGRTRRRRGFLARVRVEPYGAGRIRPHERTHPGAKEDRLRLTRATRANLSPIFALYSDPAAIAWSALAPATALPPWGAVTDGDGTIHRVWRVADAAAIATVQSALADAELLIADGHHRYETARTYAEELGGEGPHRYVLAGLVALEDPGLAVFPIHRLVASLEPSRREALSHLIRRDFEIAEVDVDELEPPAGAGPLQLGYIDAHHQRPLRLTLRDQAIADAALSTHGEAYRGLDTAVLEALILKGALGMSDEDISRLNGLSYSPDASEAVGLVRDGRCDAAFMMRPTPLERVRAVAADGESMPQKSTFFYPKLLTGLVFNPLS